MTADFRNLLIQAKQGDDTSFNELLVLYNPLLLRESVVDGVYDEDLYQENCIIFLKCVRAITLDNVKFISAINREKPE